MPERYAVQRSLRHLARAGGLVIADVLALYLAFVVGYLLRAVEPKATIVSLSFMGYCLLLAALVPAWIAVFAACGLYTTRRSHSRAAELGRVIIAVTIGVMLLIVVDYLHIGIPLFGGRKVPLYALALGIVLVVIGRAVFRRILRSAFARGHGLHAVLIVGTGALAERIAADLLQPGKGNTVIAVVGDPYGGGLAGHRGLPVYASVEEALRAHHVVIDEIVHAEPDADREHSVALMQLANNHGMGYRFVPDLYGAYAAGSIMSTIAGVPVMEVRLTVLDGWATFGKRAIDVTGALVGLFLFAPLFATIALLVKLTDPSGPVLYRQHRLGRGGKAIGIYKFRSMRWAYSTGANRPYQTAEQAFVAMGRPDLVAEFSVAQKVANDPRISPIGRFLRSTSLDELPQLVNTLFGHISLVGPRPITPEELNRYGDHRASFLALKPGITGLWQVSGRSETGYDERVKLDVHYVQNWTAWLDLAIIVRTFHAVAIRRGAH